MIRQYLFFISVFLFCACAKDTPDRTNNYDIQAFASLDWGEETTFVIGHNNPDTDATCSAICYAYLMRQLGYDVEARVAGKVNNETAFVLDRFDTEIPEILKDASGKRMILTDHSDIAQAVDGIEKARILQIIDHHGLGSIVEDISGHNIGVTCVNSRADNHNDICSRMLAVMPKVLTDNGRDLVFAIVSNVQDEYTDILFYGKGAQAAAESAFGQASGNRIRIQGLISRKKDFIPKIILGIESSETAENH